MGKKSKRRKSPNGFAMKSLKGNIKTFSIDDFHLLDRHSILCFLKFVEMMRGDISKKVIDVRDEETMNNFHEVVGKVEELRTSNPKRFSKLKPINLVNSNTYAIPVSIFHSIDDDTCFYLPLTPEEYMEIINGGTPNFGKNDGRRFVGTSPTNTFKLPLDQITLLEEILPYKTPTTNELIELGQIDEDIQPFTVYQVDDFVETIRKNTPKKVFKDLYEHDFQGELVIRRSFRNGTVGFQPQKSKQHWEKVVGSVPIQILDKEGVERRVLVPQVTNVSSYSNWKDPNVSSYSNWGDF